MKLLKSQTGAIDIILIAVVVVLVAGLGGYVYYQQQQNNKAYDAAKGGVTVTKKAKKPAAAKPKPEAKKMFAITEFKVQGEATDGVTLKYTIKTSEGIPSAFFTSAEQLALEPACTAEFGPGGTISQYPPGGDYHGSMIDTNPAAKKVGNYYYIHTQPQAYCSDSQANQAKEAAIQAAVKKVLATLEATP
jgi:hypothetical protein